MKPYLTIDEQVEMLRARGMTIDGDPERWLRAVNYYRLSGYWYIYRVLSRDGRGDPVRTDRFSPETSFSTVVGL